jgi:hypothetical protein
VPQKFGKRKRLRRRAMVLSMIAQLICRRGSNTANAFVLIMGRQQRSLTQDRQRPAPMTVGTPKVRPLLIVPSHMLWIQSHFFSKVMQSQPLRDTSRHHGCARRNELWKLHPPSIENVVLKLDRGLPHPSLRQLTIESNSRNLAMTGDVAYG